MAAARGRGRRRPPLGACGRAPARLAPGIRRGQGSSRRRDRRVGQLLAADHARFARLRDPERCGTAARADVPPANGPAPCTACGRRPGLRTTAAFVAFVGLVPIVVLDTLQQVRVSAPSTLPGYHVDAVIVDRSGCPSIPALSRSKSIASRERMSSHGRIRRREPGRSTRSTAPPRHGDSPTSSARQEGPTVRAPRRDPRTSFVRGGTSILTRRRMRPTGSALPRTGWTTPLRGDVFALSPPAAP